MNVTCGSCAARYAVPDAKVQGRKVRIKCKKCGTPILIDGTAPDAPAGAPSVPARAGAPAGSGQRSASKQTMVGMPGNARATRPSSTFPAAAMAGVKATAPAQRTVSP